MASSTDSPPQLIKSDAIAACNGSLGQPPVQDGELLDACSQTVTSVVDNLSPADQGDRWQPVSTFLPPVYCVRFA